VFSVVAGWLNGLMGGWMDVWMVGLMDEWMDGWMPAWMDGHLYSCNNFTYFYFLIKLRMTPSYFCVETNKTHNYYFDQT